MGRTPRTSVILAVLLALLVLVSAFAAVGTLSPPKWPQSFALAQGGSTGFGLPITQPGQVVVAVALKAGSTPIAVVVEEPVSKTVLPATKATAGAPISTYTYNFTAANVALAKYKTWVIIVTAAGQAVAGRLQVTASGTVTVKEPAVDLAALKLTLSSVLAQQQAGAKTLVAQLKTPSKTSSAFSVQLATKTKTQQAQTLAAGKALVLRVNTLAAQEQAALNVQATSVFNSLAIRLGGRKLPPVHRLPVGPPAATPTIVSVTPAKAGPGDPVVVQVSGLKVDLTQTNPLGGCGVFFVIYSKGGFWAKVLSCTPGEPATLRVVVPFYPGANVDFAGKVAVQDLTGKNTDYVPFQYVAIPTPAIASVTSPTGTYRPGTRVTVTGVLPTGSKVLFYAPGIWDTEAVAAVAPGITPTTTSTTVIVPNYASDVRFPGAVRLQLPLPTGGVEYSDSTSIMLDASRVTLSKVSGGGSAMGDYLQLDGQGFGETAGEVHIKAPPSGADVKGTVLTWHDQHIVIQAPEFSGITTTYVGSLSVKTVDGQVSGSQPWTWTPVIVHREMNLQTALGSDWTTGVGVENMPRDNTDYDDTWSFASPTAITASHYSEWLWPRNDHDKWFLNFHLQNGWKVESIEFVSKCDGGAVKANPVANGGTSMYIDVGWHVDPGCEAIALFNNPRASYTIHVHIMGPKGMPAGDGQ